ncbi:hypothetical protein NPIL_19101 [Nephila pilipes]|uniref:Uncharacterized protein n=1 Tax=Nephila pilipes TaxID=299642 RepID=A0A8X6TMY7_NEPPI|nr:hypothetical protein NPIL_19101 [Nephila pilipes]
MVRCTFLWKSRLSGVICRFVPLVPIGSPITNGLGPLLWDPGLQSRWFCILLIPLKGLRCNSNESVDGGLRGHYPGFRPNFDHLWGSSYGNDYLLPGRVGKHF